MAPHIGWIGRHREIHVGRTRSGNGYRIRDRAKKHDAYAYPNSGNNIVVQFDNLKCIWPQPGPDSPAHRLPPHSLHRAVRYLISMMWQQIARDELEALRRAKWEMNKAICQSCGQEEPYEGYVDRRTGQCQLCDDIEIDLAEEREAEEAMRAARAEMATPPALAWQTMMDKYDATHPTRA